MVQRPWVFRHRTCWQPQSGPAPGLGASRIGPVSFQRVGCRALSPALPAFPPLLVGESPKLIPPLWPSVFITAAHQV